MTRCELIPSDVLDRVEETLERRAVHITHGRHCVCSSCAQEDWTDPYLAPCGLHGAECPRVYDPRGLAGDVLRFDPTHEALRDARFLESVEARRVRDVLIGFPHASEDRLCSMLAPIDRAVVRRVLALLKEPA